MLLVILQFSGALFPSLNLTWNVENFSNVLSVHVRGKIVTKDYFLR